MQEAKRTFRRRHFLGAGLAVGALGSASKRVNAAGPGTAIPKLAMITEYSEPKVRFAGTAGYEGIVIPVNASLDPDRLSDSQVDRVAAVAREAGVNIISLECMDGFNHIAAEPSERRRAQARFVRALELGHRLGCKFVGTFSGGRPGSSPGDQAKQLASAVNEQYLPVCEKLDLRIGTENYPAPINFATVPAVWEQVFALIPNQRFGLEFDPSHLVRQFIDPIRTAWDFRQRILAVHAKDTEIITPVLNKVGIHGEDWWRYRIPGQGRIDWPAFFTVLLEAQFRGGIAVEHEDPFWDDKAASPDEFPQARKDGFILAARFLRQYLPGRLG
jgi:sugar phosphate isomerase/epimerase